MVVPIRRLVLIAIAGALPLVLALTGLFVLRDAARRPRVPRLATARAAPRLPISAAELHRRARSRWSRAPRQGRGADVPRRAVRRVLPDDRGDGCAGSVAGLDAQDRRSVAFVAISTDPREDTPAAVRGFLRRYRAEGVLEYLIGPRRRCGARGAITASSFEATGSDTMHSAPVRIYAPGGEGLEPRRRGRPLAAQPCARHPSRNRNVLSPG